MLFLLLLGEHQICYEQVWYIAFDWWLIGASHKEEKIKIFFIGTKILVVTILWSDETPSTVLNAWQFRALFFHFFY